MFWKADADSTAPTITLYNCTSCNPPDGDTTEPFTTEDTTPTFVIDTDKDAYCAISKNNENYTAMINGNLDRNCSNGPSQQLTCTLQPSDALIVNQTDYVYFACQDTSGNENITSTSSPKQMEIDASQTEILGDDAIERAINSSLTNPSKYSSQQVYARNISNGQSRGRFDWFVVQTSPARRWAINYVTTDDPTSGFTNMFNMTPVFMVLELQDMTETEINETVYNMLEDTKN